MGCTCYSDDTYKNNKENNHSVKKKELEEKNKSDKKTIKSSSIKEFQRKQPPSQEFNNQRSNQNEIFIDSNNQHDFNFPDSEKVYVGEGVKQMRGYISHLDIEDLRRKRKEFWETRVEGDQEVWSTLKACCEEIEPLEIPLFLEAAGIKLYKDCINVTYDSKGKSYVIPNYCINPPFCYNKSLMIGSSIKCIELNEEIALIVKYFSNTFEININDTIKVDGLKQVVLEKYNQLNKTCLINKTDIRLFFGGKELNDDIELFKYNIKPHSIILMNIKLK